MKKNDELNEVTIQYALKEGLITAREARVMLMVYLKKSNFNPIPSQVISNQTFLNTHRL